MEPITYQRIRRRRRSCRGFRLNSRRFSVSKLRAKFAWLLRILNAWRRSYSRTLRSLTRINKLGRSKRPSSAAQPRFAADRAEYRLKSFRRSNSFYAEAIADCLDFIKTSSAAALSSSIDGPPADSPHHLISS